MNRSDKISYSSSKNGPSRATIALAGTSSIQFLSTSLSNTTTPTHHYSSSLSPSSTSLNPAFINSESFGIDQSNNLFNKYQLDLGIINQKIADLQADMMPTRSSSPIVSQLPSPANNNNNGNGINHSNFVNGLRSIAADNNNYSGGGDHDKQSQLLRIIDRISELDRLVLKKTSTLTPTMTEPRRKQGCDLFILPTHMQMIDRLMDLYAQIKRPVVDHSTTLMTFKPNTKSNATTPKLVIDGEAMMDSTHVTSNENVAVMQDKIDKLTKQLDESENKRKGLDNENTKLKKKVQSLQSDLSSARDKANQLKDEMNSKSNNDTQALILELNQLRSSYHVNMEHICNVITKKTEYLNDHNAASVNATSGQNHHAMMYDEYHLPKELSDVLIQYDDSFRRYDESCMNQIEILKNVKQSYEDELCSYQLERDMYKKDMMTRNAEYEALKTAFNSLETELIVAQRQNAMNTNDQVIKLTEELKQAKERALFIQNESNELIHLNEKMMLIEQEKISYETLVRQMKEEVEAYKRLNDSLKDKIRNMNGHDGKEFLDTFEQVMRDEMMTMKNAFEAKLRAAKEDSEALSRRHLVEINRIKSAHSQSLLSPSSKSSKSSSSESQIKQNTDSNLI